jgi:hypothetical protein
MALKGDQLPRTNLPTNGNQSLRRTCPQMASNLYDEMAHKRRAISTTRWPTNGEQSLRRDGPQKANYSNQLNEVQQINHLIIQPR